MDYNQVKELINIIEGTDFTNFELSIDGVSVAMQRNNVKMNNVQCENVVATNEVVYEKKEAPVAVTEAAPAPVQGGNVVTSPIVGTFYASAAPDKPAYVKVGDKVSKGDVLCIVEAMKFMNEITSEFDGTVAEILASDEEMVEYGQPLFRIV